MRIRRNALLNLVHNFMSFVRILCFEIVAFVGLSGFEHYDLSIISPMHHVEVKLDVNHTLKLVGCRRVTLQPTTLLKWTVVVLPCPSNIVLPVVAGMM
jgi:hypothetical protein